VQGKRQHKQAGAGQTVRTTYSTTTKAQIVDLA
jgi:hypothetical protein